MKRLNFLLWIIIVFLNIGTIYFTIKSNRLNKKTIEMQEKTFENLRKIRQKLLWRDRFSVGRILADINKPYPQGSIGANEEAKKKEAAK